VDKGDELYDDMTTDDRTDTCGSKTPVVYCHRLCNCW